MPSMELDSTLPLQFSHLQHSPIPVLGFIDTIIQQIPLLLSHILVISKNTNIYSKIVITLGDITVLFSSVIIEKVIPTPGTPTLPVPLPAKTRTLEQGYGFRG
ncbi:hypothetical protein EI94DRAFT_1699681 [Lactarius quietus]|nr:hypothetical protein EI94DRAFT_1699681 [Lactarius quietus]